MRVSEMEAGGVGSFGDITASLLCFEITASLLHFEITARLLCLGARARAREGARRAGCREAVFGPGTVRYWNPKRCGVEPRNDVVFGIGSIRYSGSELARNHGRMRHGASWMHCPQSG